MAHDVFISYSNKDKPIADAVCANLETEGIRCWIAPRDIAPGDDWPTSIANAIAHSHIMVLIFSAYSNASEDVGRELYLAANNKLVIIPFKIEDIEPEPGKRYYLARTHWLDAMNPPTREQIQTLVNRVKTIVSSFSAEKPEPIAPVAPAYETKAAVGQPHTGIFLKKAQKPRGRKLALIIGGPCLLILASLGAYYGIYRPNGLDMFRSPAQGSSSATPTFEETIAFVETPIIKTEPVKLTWFIGLENPDATEKIALQQAAVDDFNATHENIVLSIQAVPYSSAEVTLQSLIEAGNAPDILGPMSISQAYFLHGECLDLTPYLDQVDTSIFNPMLMSMYLTDEGQVSLPYLAFPPAMIYNPAAFERADLEQPPARYGELYILNGVSMDWSWNTVAEVGRRLTLDGNGRNATEPGFDKRNIVQYGFSWPWSQGPNPYFGSGFLLQGAPGAYSAVIPDTWKEAWRWYYDGIWGSQPFIPNADVARSAEFGSYNTFNSGKIAMTVMPNWYLGNLPDYFAAGKDIEFGILPKGGAITGRVDDLAFRIWKGTKHPAEAVQVLEWLVTVAVDSIELGATETPPAFLPISAVTSKQQESIDSMVLSHPFVMQWEILISDLSYPAIPSLYAWTPNYAEAQNRYIGLQNSLISTPGLDLDQEFSDLETELTTIFNK